MKPALPTSWRCSAPRRDARDRHPMHAVRTTGWTSTAGGRRLANRASLNKGTRPGRPHHRALEPGPRISSGLRCCRRQHNDPDMHPAEVARRRLSRSPLAVGDEKPVVSLFSICQSDGPLRIAAQIADWSSWTYDGLRACTSACPTIRRLSGQVFEMVSENRLQLKPYRSVAEHTDGAWWPRSTDLVNELPDLVTSVSDRVGQVVMVGYHRDAWCDAPTLTEITGHTIELLGFTSDEQASVMVIGQDGRHLILQVIRPDASAEVARQALEEARLLRGTDLARDSLSTIARSVADVANKLARHEGLGDEQRTAQIKRWCEESAQQFVDAPVQAFVPILVEHIVRNRMMQSRAAIASTPFHT